MTWVAVAVGGATLVTGYMGSKAAGDAADASSEASRYAADLQNQQYQQNRTDLAPYREVGTNALNQLAGGYGIGPNAGQNGFTADPGYQFRLEEGQRLLGRQNAASGGLYSGAAGRELARFGQGLASQEYGNYFNRLASLAGIGQTATTATGQFGANAAQNAGQFAQNAGDARASGYLGQANAWGNALNSGAQAFGAYQNGGFGGGGGIQTQPYNDFGLNAGGNFPVG